VCGHLHLPLTQGGNGSHCLGVCVWPPSPPTNSRRKWKPLPGGLCVATFTSHKLKEEMEATAWGFVCGHLHLPLTQGGNGSHCLGVCVWPPSPPTNSRRKWKPLSLLLLLRGRALTQICNSRFSSDLLNHCSNPDLRFPFLSDLLQRV